MNKFVQKYYIVELLLIFISILCVFVFPIWLLLSQKTYYHILDDESIERKCTKKVVTVYREIYTDENENVVLVIDRTME